jgi:thioredoxin reductase (NADPH)
VIIIGGGPAGLTAGLYACRAKLKTLLIEKALCGGQVLIADVIENFPGFPSGTTGPELSDRLLKQAAGFGLEVGTAEAVGISQDKNSKVFSVKYSDGKEILAASVILAAGARWNRLGVPGEDRLIGRGVSYCATCDGPLFKNKKLAVIGGGDTALGEAIFLTKFAEIVTVVHRRDRLRATKVIQERADLNKKISYAFNSTAVEIIGTNKVEGLKVRDVNTSAERIIPVDGIFIFVGVTPNSEMVKGIVKTDESGCVVTDDEMRTSVEGIFACGDLRKKLLRQIVTAAGDGATAAFSAEHYVERIKGTEYK